jgi:hypothetical protein
VGSKGVAGGLQCPDGSHHDKCEKALQCITGLETPRLLDTLIGELRQIKPNSLAKFFMDGNT